MQGPKLIFLAAFTTVVASAPLVAGEDGSAEELVRRLRSERSAADRAQVAQELAALGRKAESALIGAWRVGDRRSAVDVILLIERLGSEEAREDLIRATLHTWPEIRRTAAEGLGAYPHPSTEKALFRLIRDFNEDVACAAIDTLGYLESETTHKPLLRELRDYADRDPRGKRAQRLVKVVSSVLKQSKSRDLVREIFRIASQSQLETQHCFLKVLAVGEPEVTPPILREVLQEYLEGESYRGRGFGDALGDTSAASNFYPISVEFAEAACLGLGRAGDRVAAPTLVAALSAPETRIRMAALTVLHLTLPPGPERLLESAPPDFPTVRRDAIWAVMTRLTDRAHGLRERAYVWLKRETRLTDAPRNYAAWKTWYTSYFGERSEFEEEVR